MKSFWELFRPGRYVSSITDIDCAQLKAEGYELVMLDLDNTLLPWRSSTVPDAVKQWVEYAKSLGLKLYILSNTHNPRRLSKVADELGIPSVAQALKPRRRGFLKAVEIAACERSRAVVIGDQLLTDIFGGNRAGVGTILVKPMHPYEFLGTKISRLVERGIMAVIRRSSEAGTKSESIQSQTQDGK